MDPNTNLEEQQSLVANILHGKYHESCDLQEDATRLAELQEALDQWISRGGFLPSNWVPVPSGRPPMETRLLIWEPIVHDDTENFYLERSGPDIIPPNVGEIITVKRANLKAKEPGRPYREKEYPTRVQYKVTSRKTVIYEAARSQPQSMVCEITVERIGK